MGFDGSFSCCVWNAFIKYEEVSVLSFSDASKEPCLPYVCDLLVQSLQTFQTCYARIGIYWQAELATFIISYLPTNRLQDPSLYIIPTQTRTHKSDWIPNCNVDEVMLVTKLILWGLIIFGQKPAKGPLSGCSRVCAMHHWYIHMKVGYI